MSYTEPVSYFENYDRYRYEDPEFPGAPLKEDWWWELNAPTSDATALQMAREMFPSMGENDPGVITNADPLLQDILSEIVADRDLAEARTYFNSDEVQARLRDQIGKSYWNELRKRGVLTEDALPGEQLDELAVKDFVNPGIENLLAQYYPSDERAMGQLQFGLESAGGRPIPMGELPGYEGAGFAQAEGGQMTEGGAPTQTAAGNPIPRGMQQRLEDVLAQKPALEMMPRNAYHTALMQRMGGRRGYYGTGRQPSTAGFWRGIVRQREEEEAAGRRDAQERRSRRHFGHAVGDFLDRLNPFRHVPGPFG